MAVNQYDLGYNHFFEQKTPMTSEALKASHPIFRNGYRKAMEDYNKRTNKTFPTVLFDIPRRPEVFVPEWSDILAATRRPRYAKLHYPHMAPMLNMIVKSVDMNKHRVKRYKDVLMLIDEAFNFVLQYGYDTGVLDMKDLKQYNYTPK